MISAYKFYQGVVLSEIVDLASEPVTIDELKEDGRLTSYVLNHRAGLHIKHSTRRMTPWGFTFSRSNAKEFLLLRRQYREVFVALVCHTDGIVTLTLKELVMMLAAGASENGWIRIERRPSQQYTVLGNRAALPCKKERGVAPIVNYISTSATKTNGDGMSKRRIPELSRDASVFQENSSLIQ